jgi:hypothetical protein
MKLPLPVVIAVLFSVAGCQHLFRGEEFYVSVTMQNQSDVKITGVSIGSGKSCSRFGVLGSKGAGKGAVVPVCFRSNFPVQWEEGDNEKVMRADVDLRNLVGSNYITLIYKGNGVWVAKRDEDKK